MRRLYSARKPSIYSDVEATVLTDNPPSSSTAGPIITFGNVLHRPANEPIGLFMKIVDVYRYGHSHTLIHLTLIYSVLLVVPDSEYFQKKNLSCI